MVRSYYLSENGEEQEPIALSEVEKLGVVHASLNPKDYSVDLKKICDERGYNYQDVIQCDPDHLPDYANKVKVFAEEHLHTDDEVRFFIEGQGYFDVRAKDDRWVRLELVAGDLISLPAGIYHRFVVDDRGCFARVIRLFKGDPVWTPFNRTLPDTDEKVIRKDYLASLEVL